MTTTVRRRGPALAALAVTQVVAWGVLYYAVLVAVPAIAADTGWDDRLVFAVVTGGLLVSAICAVPTGLLLDRRPRRVMVAGAALGTLALSAAAAAPTIWAFAGAWILCGVAQSGVLYQAAFTVITHRYRERRRGPLTLVTLAGGLASTVFAPLTGWLVLEVGWRGAFVVLAVIIASVALPIYAITIETTWSHLGSAPVGGGEAGAALRSRRFWAVAASLALISFALYAVTLSAVSSSLEKGLDLQAASWVLGLIGLGQVLGRLLYLTLPHATAAWIAPALVGMLGAAALSLYGSVSSPAAILGCAVAMGAIRGAFTLVQASAVTDRWGSASYGRLNGVLAAPVVALTAFAPWAAASLATAFGTYSVVAFTMAGLCALGGALVIRR